jgi:hypothetical protein
VQEQAIHGVTDGGGALTDEKPLGQAGSGTAAPLRIDLTNQRGEQNNGTAPSQKFDHDVLTGLDLFHRVEGRHIDNVAKANIAFLDVMERIVDVLDVDQLNVRTNAMFRAEIKHLLRVGKVADQ